VASEVKTLAARTANATDEIGNHISAIQQSTADAVVAIRTIGGVMTEINQSAAAIAAAVDQQSASTHEIARNTQYTADRANELATTMSTVTGAIAETNQSARQVSSAASALTEQAGTLQRAVEGFLSRVAAA
jgi:methyl-accepting chemotaxis protein